jgi:hypothetical protein
VTAVTAVTESRDAKQKELQSRLGLSKMSNKKYRCPYCEQTSSRRWNLEVHLKRRHQATGELVGLSQARPAYNDEPRYGFKPREILSGRLGQNDYTSVDLNTFSRGDGRGERIDIERNSLDDSIKNLRRVVEFKRLARELNPQYQQSPLWLMPSIQPSSINYPDEFLRKFDSMAFTPETDPLRDRIIGLRCHICETCLSTVPLPMYGFKEFGKIVPSLHHCNSLRVANMQGLSYLDRRSKVMELYRSSPQTMKKAVQEWWLDGLSPYPILVPLISAEKDSYEFTPQLLKNYRWLPKVIEEEQITLDDNYLDEFMSFTRGNTFIKFSIREAKTMPRVSSYFITLSRGPFLPFKFTIDNPRSQL